MPPTLSAPETRFHSYNADSTDRIDNTPVIYSELDTILATQNPSTIAINVDPDISFSSGLHSGELSSLSSHLGREWTAKFVSVPMVAVELVASKVPTQLEWYRKLQGTAWAMIEEAFSERVITPGKTTTEVLAFSILSLLLLHFLFISIYYELISTNPGRRMVPPLQSPSHELHNLVPPRRNHYRLHTFLLFLAD